MNQNFYNSNSSGIDQTQPPQFPVIHPPPQETSIEILHDQENAINSVQTFLRKFNRYSFFKTLKVLLLAWDRVFKIKDAFGNKQHKPEDIQELFHDDEDYTIAITPYFLITDSLIMGDEHLDTIPEKESDEFIKSSVQNLVSNPSELEDECECDVPDCDDSQTIKFSTFSNPLFDDSTFSDDESSHEEVIHEMSFKTYSNPLFDLNEKIISNEFNPIHNEDLDSTPKNNRFDTKSYLLESLLNRDESIPPVVQYSRKCEDSCQRILSSKSSFPQLQMGNILLYLAGSQPMLKSSYKAEDGVIISIPPLVGGMTDVVVEIKGTGWSISITFRFSMGLQTPDDLSRSRLGFIEKMGVHG
uniref:Uncharacterized protein n=1 Tax=Tanacetum cinerariifolium TaxID=118510 RepID=A0A6L2K2X3_TANCI|nr:hypothetical protein [Tanacetum cinerariifolium]